jgi:hypothetical protein
MDKVYGTEAAQLLGISRSTMLRLDRSKKLPADGKEPDGSRYWLRSTLHSYISGKPNRTSCLYIRSCATPGMAAAEKSFQALASGTVIPIDLQAVSAIAALQELFTLLGTHPTSALGVGASFALSPLFPALAAFALENGSALILVPDR